MQLLQIVGLDNFTLPQTHLKQSSVPMPHAGGSGPSGQFLPSDMRAAYYGNGALTGAGQSIGIFSFEGYNLSDVTLFYQHTGMTSTVPINNVLVNGFSGACNGCDDGEQVLDIVNAIGMAPGITQILFYEGSSATAILNKMVTDNKAKVLSCSWYGADFNNVSDDPIYKQMAAQGQTFVNASGDLGAYNNKTWGAPSADPWVLEVGGTDLTTNGAGGSWSSETAWVDSGGGFFSGAGEATPSYQLLAGVHQLGEPGFDDVPQRPGRMPPEANFDNPIVSRRQIVHRLRRHEFRCAALGRISGAGQPTGGRRSATATVGFVNPALYNVGLSASYATSLHDITVGSNPSNGGKKASFNAVAGFDLVTGWGSPQAALINALAGGGGTGTNQPPTANFTFTTSGLTATFTDSSTDSDGTIASRSWNFGDSSTSTATNPSHTYAAPAPTGDRDGDRQRRCRRTTSKSVTVTTTSGNVLTNGVPVTGLAATTGNELNYTMVVPAGATNLKFVISGGTGDADLYVKFGSAPTTSSYDCRPYVTGNSETCTIATIQAGTYYVMLNAYASFSGVTLTGSYTAPGSGGTPTANFTFTTSGLTATFTDYFDGRGRHDRLALVEFR